MSAGHVKFSAGAVRDGSRADAILEISIQSVLTVGASAHIALEDQGHSLAAVGAEAELVLEPTQVAVRVGVVGEPRLIRQDDEG